MKILLTGFTGYIGKRLFRILFDQGHHIVLLVRRPIILDLEEKSRVTVIEGDLLDRTSLEKLPKEIDAAYYFVHSMCAPSHNFEILEKKCAENFVGYLKTTTVSQLIYLSGLSSDRHLSQHLSSRKAVEKLFIESGLPYTILQAGVIIGAGSASFEMIRDLVEKLPFMVTPRWVKNKTEPIGVLDVLFYLSGVLGKKEALGQIFEIGNGEKLTYKEMLLRYAKIRGLKRWIIDVPVLTPRLSSYWLYFVTSTNFALASTLVHSLENETVCHDMRIQALLPHTCLSYDEVIKLALEKIEQNHVVSSWKDALNTYRMNPNLDAYIHVPSFGCFTNHQTIPIGQDPSHAIKKIWSIGGSNGWYYANWLWNIRGIIDKIVGGTGLNRGRRDPIHITAGDSIDFWRVLVANKTSGRLLLYAEMKLPGEAWLEFKITKKESLYTLEQTATFRPKGVLGRLYWYSLTPLHFFIFRGMIKAIAR